MSESMHNRRDGFRIDDELKLKVKAIDPEELAGIESDFDAFRSRYCLKAHLLSQSEMRKPKLARISKSDPDVAEYLEHLEEQISHLAARVASAGDGDFDVITTKTPVNMSAGGLNFVSNCTYDIGQCLELGLALESSGVQLVTVAEVLRTESNKEGDAGGYWITAAFRHIHFDDTEAIIRHMAKLQQQQLQARRNTEGNGDDLSNV